MEILEETGVPLYRDSVTACDREYVDRRGTKELARGNG